MIEDNKISSVELPEEIEHHKHLPSYLPFVVVGLLFAIALFGLFVSNSNTPQVAGASTENTSTIEP